MLENDIEGLVERLQARAAIWSDLVDGWITQAREADPDAVSAEAEAIMRADLNAQAASQLLAMKSEIAAMKGALEDLGQWASSYPVSIFPEPDLDRVTAILTEAGEREQMDRMHASWARNLLGGIEKRALDALISPNAGGGDAYRCEHGHADRFSLCSDCEAASMEAHPTPPEKAK
jgi:hypothetical protein